MLIALATLSALVAVPVVASDLEAPQAPATYSVADSEPQNGDWPW